MQELVNEQIHLAIAEKLLYDCLVSANSLIA